MSIDQEIFKKAKHWASSNAFSKETNLEIQKLLDDNNTKELTDRFYRDLEFGTGGLRGIMGAGTARMNLYNIRKATQALANYMIEKFGKRDLTGEFNGKLKVAISYDCRNNAKLFAQSAAEVLAANGIASLITKELRPTPMLSYAVRHFKCQAGICITASHNPPAYNGYKVYWQTGGQLVPPHDQKIMEHYQKITDYDAIKFLPYAEAISQKMVQELGEELDQVYFKTLSGIQINRPTFQPKIVYTPIHGTGITAVPKALELFGFKDVNIVSEQALPNGNFPTVKSPNPEDREALEMALALGEKINADLILATDPDSDRIAMIVREKEQFIEFNGNQLGCLLTEYVLSSQKNCDRLPSNPLVIKTIVTTELQREIAEYYGAHCEDTLTGFKWICDLIEKYESGQKKPYRKFVCGGEESYGFMCDSFVRDKDAIAGCVLAAEMYSHYRSQDKSLTDVLNSIFLRHGVYQESLHTITLPGKDGSDKIRSMMESLRKHPPTQIDGLSVRKIWDLEQGLETVFHENAKGEKTQTPLEFPKSDVLQFFLEGDAKVSIRPSGTEPKIKFYISVKQGLKTDSGQGLEAAKQTALIKVKRLQDAFVALAE